MVYAVEKNIAAPNPDKDLAISNWDSDSAFEKNKRPKLNINIPPVMNGRLPYLSESTPMGICGNAIHTINEPMITPSIVSLMLRSLLIAGSIGIRDKIPVKAMNRPIERIIIILFLQLEN